MTVIAQCNRSGPQHHEQQAEQSASPIPSMASQPGERSGRCRGRILGAHGVGQSQCQHTLDAKPFQMKDALRWIQCRAGLGQSRRARCVVEQGDRFSRESRTLFQQGKAGGRGIRSVGQSRNLRGDPPAASTGHQHAALGPDLTERTDERIQQGGAFWCHMRDVTRQREQRDAGTLRDAPHVTDERRIMPGRTAKRCRGGRLHQDEIEAALRLLGQESAGLDTRCPDVGAGAGGGDGVEQQRSITRIRGAPRDGKVRPQRFQGAGRGELHLSDQQGVGRIGALRERKHGLFNCAVAFRQ